jgi:bacteriocin biosynthesis cyclodehydratase domain-containing protein
MRYSQNPSLHYLQVSDDEVIVKGSHLEGFSLIVSDDTNRGLAARVIDALGERSSTQDVHRAVAATVAVTADEIGDFLEQLANAGAVLRHDSAADAISAWTGFLRYGQVEPAAQRHPLVVAGGTVAADVVDSISRLGMKAEHVPLPAPDDLARFAVSDRSMLVAEAFDAASNELQVDDRVSEADIPDDDTPRLAVLVEGAPLKYLFALNESAVEQNVPVLYAQIAGSDYAVGPYVVPGATGCFWEFERQRSRSLFSYSEYAVLVSAGRSPVTPAVTQAAAAAAIVPSLVELALLGRSMLAGQVLRGRSTTAETSRHSVMRLPRCPTCLPLRPLLRNLLF